MVASRGKRDQQLSIQDKVASCSQVQRIRRVFFSIITIGWKAMEQTKKASPSKGLLQTEELYQYILETSMYPREPAPFKELRDATASHPWSVMATAPDADQLMTLLLKLVNPKNTIEIGVFTGYSLLFPALTIPDDGKITAIVLSRESYKIGLSIIRKAGVEHKINIIKSEALPVLDKLLESVRINYLACFYHYIFLTSHIAFSRFIFYLFMYSFGLVWFGISADNV
ncbi:probable caffeoyl-CoA O-methyltransferase At4g26220 [Actinidia eriantha]|uniref:probable caffeoyl-CoA O-methyltransferase At4g26220 n=1 Tax=Actinidia eriantha TaxID=165200 RepID=UPI002585054C|nr:probable caffeoyl-CoA O-methyltransferase At4g26220 [Actinidia eriantha]